MTNLPYAFFQRADIYPVCHFNKRKIWTGFLSCREQKAGVKSWSKELKQGAKARIWSKDLEQGAGTSSQGKKLKQETGKQEQEAGVYGAEIEDTNYV